MVLERISRNEMLMDVAKVVARRGSCSRLQVGVVFAREGRILATGYNGAPPRMAHCTHESYVWPTTHQYMAGGYPSPPLWLEIALREYFDDPEPGTEWFWDGKTISNNPRCTIAEHAERNAIAFAAREGIRLGDSDVFCTHAPCADCARALISTEVKSVTYDIPYRITTGVELLMAAKIKVIDNSPLGTVV